MKKLKKYIFAKLILSKNLKNAMIQKMLIQKAMSQTMTDFLKLIKYFILSLKYGLDTISWLKQGVFCEGRLLFRKQLSKNGLLSIYPTHLITVK